MGLIRRRSGPRRRRRAFSLNGLAIQLSAFAISSTLVALLVVTGSQAAFVEENEVVTQHVPLGLPEQDDAGTTRSRARAGSAAPEPGPTPTPTAEEPAPVVAEPAVPTPAPTTARPEPADPTVELSDSDVGTAMFGGDAVLVPGAAIDRCTTVTYTGDADPAPVRLSATGVSGDLAPYLELVVDIGPADAGASCADLVPSGTLYRGTLARFAAEHGSYASGLSTWDPDGDGEARRFRFRVSLRDDPAAEGATVGFGFTWETRAG